VGRLVGKRPLLSHQLLTLQWRTARIFLRKNSLKATACQKRLVPIMLSESYQKFRAAILPVCFAIDEWTSGAGLFPETFIYKPTGSGSPQIADGQLSPRPSPQHGSRGL